MAQTVVAVFKYHKDVEAAIKQLRELNYNPADFSILMKDIQVANEIHESTGVHVAKNTASGAVVGGALAGLTGLFVGLGVFTLPGLGAILAGGPIASMLGLTGAAAATTTATLSGILAGGLIGALVSLGFPQEEAQKYEEFIRAGGILLVVPSKDLRTQEVRDILTAHGASDIRQLELFANIKP